MKRFTHIFNGKSPIKLMFRIGRGSLWRYNHTLSNTKQNMKKELLILLVAGFITSEAISQEKEISVNEKSNFTAGFKFGYDKNTYAYRTSMDINGFDYYSIEPSFSAGIDFGYFVTKRFRPRIEIEYFYLLYGMNWNYGDDSDFERTLTTVHYFGYNLHLDYGLYMGERLQLFLSPGLMWDVKFHHKFKTFLRDEDDPVSNEYNLLDEKFPTSILGGSLSIPIRIKLNQELKLTLEPDYTIYFRNFQVENDEPYMRMSFKAGVEYTF